MSDSPQPPYVNPYPHLHAGGKPPLHVDIVQPNGSHEAIDIQNRLGAAAIQGTILGPPKP